MKHRMTLHETMLWIIAFLAVAAAIGANTDRWADWLGYVILAGLTIYGLAYGRTSREGMTWREWFGGGWREQR